MNNATSAGALHILLVDDHVIVREGLKRVLGATADGWTIAEACSGRDALDELRREAFNLAIVDLSLPDMSGLELIGRIRSHYPGLRLLVLSMHAEEQYALRAFKTGAHGYVTKDSASDELVTAVRKVCAGGAFVTASLAERVVQQLNGSIVTDHHSALSDRELDVLRRIACGQRLTEIAQALHLSVKTVSTHKTRIQEKLNLPTNASLIRYAMEQRLDLDSLLPAAEAGPPMARN